MNKTVNLFKRWILVLALLFCTFTQAQSDVLFYVPAAPHYTGNTSQVLRLIFSTQYPSAIATIKDGAGNLIQTVNVAGVGSTSVVLNNNVATGVTYGQDLQANNNVVNTTAGLIITADNPVSVIGQYDAGNNLELFQLMGRNALGTSFRAASQYRPSGGFGFSGGGGHFIAVMATQNGTTVTMDNTVNGFNFRATGANIASLTRTVNLNKGETYFAFSDTPDSWITGASVVSNKPISMLSGAQHINSGHFASDAGIKNITPETLCGTQFVLTEGNASFDDCDYVQVIATQPNTTVTIDGIVYPILSVAGNFAYKTFPTTNPVGTPHYILSDKPVYAFHVTAAFNTDEVGMAQLPSLDCRGGRELNFVKVPNQNNQVVVIIPTAGLSSFKLNGVAYPPNTVTVNAAPGLPSWSTFEIAAADLLADNLAKCNEPFNISILAATAGSTGLYGYVSGFDKFLDPQDPTLNVPSSQYTVASLCPGISNTHTVKVQGCATTFSILTAIPRNGAATGTVSNITGLTYTFTAGTFTGTDFVDLVIQDNLGNRTNLSVGYVGNTPAICASIPIANNDKNGTLVNSPITFSVIANDTTPTGTIVGTTIDLDPFSPGINNTFVVPGEGTYTTVGAPAGSVIFTPTATFVGQATPILYTVENSTLQTSNQATISIVVVPSACTSNILVNPSFENPVVPNINGNNIQPDSTLYPGWTVFTPVATALNIIRVNGAGYPVGPILAHEGNQYLDINGSNNFPIQTFVVGSTSIFKFSSWFSNRESVTSTGGYRPWIARIEILDNTNNIVAVSNGFNFTLTTPPSKDTWEFVQGTSAVLPAGTYKYRCYVDNYGHVDDAFFCIIPFGINAIDDIYPAVSSAGNPNLGNILINDTLSGGTVPATVSNATITTLGTTIGGAPATGTVPLVSATGQVSVPAGTPAGTYVITYQICDALPTPNCETAKVTVTVNALPPAPDFDNDGIADTVDLDDDNDGILDSVEGLSDPILTSLNVSNDVNNTTIANTAVVNCIAPKVSSGSKIMKFDIRWNNGAGGTPETAAILTVNINGVNYLTVETPSDGSSNVDNATEFGGDAIITALNGATFTNSLPSAQGNSYINHTQYLSITGLATITLTLPNAVNNINFNYVFNYDDFVVSNAQIVGGCQLDTDGDGIPNHLDLDSDNDGITDLVESGNAPMILADTNNNGIIDGAELTTSPVGADGIPLAAQGTEGTNPPAPADTDGDGNSNYIDLDSDNDGIYDLTESGNTAATALDTNNDGTLSATESPAGTDGIPNGAQIGGVNNAGVNNLPTDTDGSGGANY